MIRRLTQRWRVARALRIAGAGELGRDLAAGSTLAAIAIPEQMATARLGGFSPETGLVAFVAASGAFALFGRNRQLSAGADSTLMPIFAGALAALGATSVEKPQLAAALALIVGVVMAAAGIAKLGRIADLLSKPVISGFLAGIAVHIVLSQAPVVMGVPPPSGNVWERLRALWSEGARAQPLAIAIGLGTFAVVLATDKLNPRIPGALAALAVTTAFAAAFGSKAHGLQVLGALHAGFPAPRWPAISFGDLQRLVGLSLMLSLVVMVQTGATTRAFDPDQADVNADFVGLGAAELCAGLFGAFPVNASPPRTALTVAAGGRSQWAGVFAVLTVLLLLLFGARLLAHTPTAALAGILLFIAQGLIRVAAFRQMFRRAPEEFALALGTAVLIVVLPIQTGVAAGIFLSLAHGLILIARARLISFENLPGTTIWWPVSPPSGPSPAGEQFPGVLVIGFPAPLTFLNAYEFRRGVLDLIAAAPSKVRLFVLEASGIIGVDITAAEILCDLITKLRGEGVEVAVSRLESVRARADFERFQLTGVLGEGHLFESVHEAVAALRA